MDVCASVRPRKSTGSEESGSRVFSIDDRGPEQIEDVLEGVKGFAVGQSFELQREVSYD